MQKGFWFYTLLLTTFLTISNYKIKSEINPNKIELDKPVLSNEYFPVNKNKILLYDSDFGESELKVTKESNLNVFTFSGDDFTYRQKLLVNDSGVFVKETYQKIKVLLVLSSEGTFTYSDPLPRIKFPINAGNAWNWKGKEFDEDEVHTLDVNSKIENVETIKVPAGTFKAIKIYTTVNSSKGTKSKVTEWYAKDIGLVKMIADVEGGGIIGTARDLLGLGEIVFELKEIKTNI